MSLYAVDCSLLADRLGERMYLPEMLKMHRKKASSETTDGKYMISVFARV